MTRRIPMIRFNETHYSLIFPQPRFIMCHIESSFSPQPKQKPAKLPYSPRGTSYFPPLPTLSEFSTSAPSLHSKIMLDSNASSYCVPHVLCDAHTLTASQRIEVGALYAKSSSPHTPPPQPHREYHLNIYPSGISMLLAGDA